MWHHSKLENFATLSSVRNRMCRDAYSPCSVSEGYRESLGDTHNCLLQCNYPSKTQMNPLCSTACLLVWSLHLLMYPKNILHPYLSRRRFSLTSSRPFSCTLKLRKISARDIQWTKCSLYLIKIKYKTFLFPEVSNQKWLIKYKK